MMSRLDPESVGSVEEAVKKVEVMADSVVSKIHALRRQVYAVIELAAAREDGGSHEGLIRALSTEIQLQSQLQPMSDVSTKLLQRTAILAEMCSKPWDDRPDESSSFSVVDSLMERFAGLTAWRADAATKSYAAWKAWDEGYRGRFRALDGARPEQALKFKGLPALFRRSRPSGVLVYDRANYDVPVGVTVFVESPSSRGRERGADPMLEPVVVASVRFAMEFLGSPADASVVIADVAMMTYEEALSDPPPPQSRHVTLRRLTRQACRFASQLGQTDMQLHHFLKWLDRLGSLFTSPCYFCRRVLSCEDGVLVPPLVRPLTGPVFHELCYQQASLSGVVRPNHVNM